ncbi:MULTISPECIES: GNAT family N-acetyltransferase [Metabacillus]|jgi:ribosomal protein S18 acetylase RimI-like enzyme|uniref:GNAT family N-acetyltransferase n=1 Tax=Metabacillus rhizolycopersici TaxID=2875709 RepID=A0ABS7UKH4_9BACI|nr:MULTISPECIES: GNAT family N-acetyltransferase [Metabacillus]MBZ5748813.1 GNAT family N-acetyltransferase [Metabacillus rhizolycopersici]MCM3652457.1 GNAT family N-acetyltransferase [Metabacillus litoralis]
MNKIQRADIEDAYEILALQKLAYISEAEILGDYTIQPLTQTLDSLANEFDRNLILKYVSEGKIIGSIRANEKKGTCYISKLMVHPDHQNKGIGKALVREIEHVFGNVRYELFTSSQSNKNVSFYEKLGFTGYKTEKLATEETIFVFMEK